jgi:2'-5' RNA ligase
MKYGVAIFPSKKLQDIANSYRKRYDKKYSLIPPHITLKSAFEASESEISSIANLVHQVAHQVEPFTIHVTKAKSFHPANNTIYLKVEPTPELEQLHQALNNEAFFGENSEVTYTYIPHLTIAQEIANDEHLDLLGQLTNLNLSHQETVDRIHLLYQLEDGTWTVYETFRLGAE